MKPLKPLLWVALLALLVVSGWQIAGLLLPDRAARSPGAQIGVAKLQPFSFPDLQGSVRHSSEWQGRPLVVNFWATWCPPCRKEMPLFIEFQQQYRSSGLQFVGIAIDQADMVRDFSDVYGINFPLLIGDTQAVKWANTMGNRFDSLPFTAIFDREGNTRYVQAGEITRAILEQELLPLL